ncbi:sensor histidine kinase [Methylosinus sp. Sm6]|uniref:sensor histidine kinase n=1 Tax=Methylosinus sp. Sm6 TaxID=2866948 RepID=UPI001C99F4B3|nr:sensor histidine kinase [Methylosinus sp. Sm6]MBY6241939.1 sensor histidine kinase [Methylosinus sp. Sm6]
MKESVGDSFIAETSETKIAVLEARLAAVQDELRLERERYAELRHRIRNDLQGLATLISAQSRRLDRPEGCARCAMRLRSAAALHNALDEDGASDIRMDDYLWALSEARRNAFDDRIAGKMAADADICLDYRRAQCVGLVYVEAVTNAMKHAFPGGAAGQIAARFRRLGYDLELTVIDSGIGFDPSHCARGNGIELMRGIARQLRGRLELCSSKMGAMVRLTFPETLVRGP